MTAQPSKPTLSANLAEQFVSARQPEAPAGVTIQAIQVPAGTTVTLTIISAPAAAGEH